MNLFAPAGDTGRIHKGSKSDGTGAHPPRSNSKPYRNAIHAEVPKATEMTPVKSMLLSLAMLSSIALWGVGIYGADAASGHNVVDGYGVTVSTR